MSQDRPRCGPHLSPAPFGVQLRDPDPLELSTPLIICLSSRPSSTQGHPAFRSGNIVGKHFKSWLSSGTRSAFPGSTNPAVPSAHRHNSRFSKSRFSPLPFSSMLLEFCPSSGAETRLEVLEFLSSFFQPLLQHSPFPTRLQGLFLGNFSPSGAAGRRDLRGRRGFVGNVHPVRRRTRVQPSHPKLQPRSLHCAGVGRLFPRFAASGLWGSGGSQECLGNASAAPEGLCGGVQKGDISKTTSDRGGSEAIWKEFPWRTFAF